MRGGTIERSLTPSAIDCNAALSSGVALEYPLLPRQIDGSQFDRRPGMTSAGDRRLDGLPER